MRQAFRGKSTIILLISVIMVLSMFLAACSSNNEPKSSNSTDTANQTDTSNETTQQPKEEPTAEPVKDPDPVTLTVIGKNPADDTSMIGFFKAYTDKHPWVTIKYEQSADYNDKSILEKMAALQAAGTPADIAVVGDLTIGMKDGLFEDMTPYAQKSEEFQSYEFIDGIIEAFSLDGKMYGMPYGNAPFFTFVNKDLLAKYGMEMPSNDWTYEDFRTMAQKATDAGAGDWGIDGAFWTNVALSTIYTVANGSAKNINYLSEDLKTSIANSPDVVRDLQWVKDLVEKDKVMPGGQAIADAGITDAFTEGKALFSVGGIWNIRAYKDAVKFDWDIMPMPKGSVQQATFKFLASLALLSSSKNKDAAFDFLTFFGSTDIGKVNIDNGGTPWVKNAELDDYLVNNPIYAGKNIDAIKLSGTLCCGDRGAMVPAYGDYVNSLYTWNSVIIAWGADILTTVTPEVEKFNKATAEGRAALGMN